jgi:hypothetical protein
MPVKHWKEKQSNLKSIFEQQIFLRSGCVFATAGWLRRAEEA